MTDTQRMSMTGFAARTGSFGPWSWSWDIRSVNAKGLDVRVRVPDWIEGLEVALKGQVTAQVGRGNVQVGLRVSRLEGEETLSVNDMQLASVLKGLKVIEDQAKAAGVPLAQSRAADILQIKGVMDLTVTQDDPEALKAPLVKDFGPLLDAFNAMRAGEGQALADVLARQVDEIDGLIAAAARIAKDRMDAQQETLRVNLAKVIDGAAEADPDRVAQELALLAVKADITEELDRLAAHVVAARELLAAEGPVGRKLDFLMQEFNREANTLCSKSGSSALTRVGLDLKALIDQMREQVQNVE